MNFKYSCIGDNTPENRKWLEKIGYKVKSYESDDTLIWAQPRGIAYTEKELPNDNRTVNCVDNDPLFRAVTAMRSDSDYMQYFFYGKTFFLCELENIRDFRKNKSIRKATLEELKEHFNTSTNNNK